MCCLLQFPTLDFSGIAHSSSGSWPFINIYSHTFYTTEILCDGKSPDSEHRDTGAGDVTLKMSSNDAYASVSHIVTSTDCTTSPNEAYGVVNRQPLTPNKAYSETKGGQLNAMQLCNNNAYGIVEGQLNAVELHVCTSEAYGVVKGQ